MKLQTRLLGLLIVVASALAAFAPAANAQSDRYFRGETSNRKFTGDVSIARGLFLPAVDIAITSGSATFNVATSNRTTAQIAPVINLTVSNNTTAARPIGGELNQVIIIRSGAGSNTIRFDDGTSMTLGGNVTLTEAQGDVLALRCMSADGDEWERLFSADN